MMIIEEMLSRLFQPIMQVNQWRHMAILEMRRLVR